MNDEISQDLPDGYYKVAMIQGDPLGPSLQDFAASEASLLEGQKILMPAYNRHPGNVDLMLRLIEIRVSLARLMYRSGREREAIQYYLDLLPVAHRLVLLKNCSLVCKTQEAVLENDLAIHLMTIDTKQALEHAEHGITLDRALLKQYPGDITLERGAGRDHGRCWRGSCSCNLGELEESGEYYRESIAPRASVAGSTPD